jgi:DNA topoisomerase-1
VVKKDIIAQTEECVILTLKKNDIKKEIKASKDNVEKGKLVPTDTGIVVNDFLINNFPNIMDYNFTARVEENFDKIAEGKKRWNDDLISFYDKFHPDVIKASNREGKNVGERELGIDKKTDKPVFAKIGRYGAVIQIGKTSKDEKPIFASLQAGQSIETITLEEALELFKLPINIGKYEDKDVIVATGRFGAYIKYGAINISIPKNQNPLEITLETAIELIKQPRLPINLGKHKGEEVIAMLGRFGPYIKYGNINVSIPRGENPHKITLEMALELLKNKNDSQKNNEIKVFEEANIKVMNGRFGAYITHEGKNYKIPKNTEAQLLTLEQCLEIVKGEGAAKKGRKMKK